MSFRKPFRAVPLRVVPQSRAAIPAPEGRGAWLKVLGFAALVGLAIGVVTGTSGRARTVPAQAAMSSAPQVYYSGCNAARAAGAAPIYAGQPGYRPELDGDSDGIACEPWRGRLDQPIPGRSPISTAGIAP